MFVTDAEGKDIMLWIARMMGITEAAVEGETQEIMTECGVLMVQLEALVRATRKNKSPTRREGGGGLSKQQRMATNAFLQGRMEICTEI